MTLTTATVTHTSTREPISQWVSSVVNCESKSEQNASILQECLGPPREHQPNDVASSAATAAATSSSTQGHFTHIVVFKIEEKVYIESIVIYEKINASDSCITEIEALEKVKENNEHCWFSVWKKGQPCESIVRGQKYSPEIAKTPFRTDTIRITVVGTLRIIDAIEVKGYKSQDEGAGKDKKDSLAEYGQLARDLRSLIMDECLADVHFEVEGKRIAAHRAILSFRSEYFRAMLGTKSPFRESKNTNSTCIYIPNIRYEVFIQVLNFLYTGHLDLGAEGRNGELPHYVILDLMRTADLMNLEGLEHACLFDLSEMINANNVIKIYKEAHEKLPVLEKVVELCHDVVSANFQVVVNTEDYCSLEQELMIKLISHVVPTFDRLTSHDVRGGGRAAEQQPPAANIDDFDEDEDGVEDALAQELF